MDIVLSNSGKKPLYEQITEQIKRMILSGRLSCGEPLPSIRLLAKELRISVITTKRAYEELERQGLIETSPGRGSFVKKTDFLKVKEEHLLSAGEWLGRAVKEAKSGGISLEKLETMLQKLYQEENR